MFGGATSYVETLDAILEFVENHSPTTDELVGWHRGVFANVSSRDSIMRRVTYLRQAGFLHQSGGQWTLGAAGREYIESQDEDALLRIMCNRNVGLRSLLYALSDGPMSVEDISDQQLDTHPELGWTRGETDMAKQRANWLRSMGYVRKQEGVYQLTNTGWAFVEQAVVDWAGSAKEAGGLSADTYETTTYARAVDPEFRATVLSRYGDACPVSGVDHHALLDVAHVLPWSEYPEQRADLSNVLVLSKTHHAAFDRELFTLDQEYRLHVNPEFETESELLQQTLLSQERTRIPGLDGRLSEEYLARHNTTLEWY
jgi:putative restriction endonuclease